jgi:hypothetical protein
MGAAWARQGMYELVFRRPLSNSPSTIVLPKHEAGFH